MTLAMTPDRSFLRRAASWRFERASTTVLQLGRYWAKARARPSITYHEDTDRYEDLTVG